MTICIIHINQSPAPAPHIEEAPHRFVRHITPFLDLDTKWSIVRLFGDALPQVNDYDGYLITGGSAPMISKVIPETTALLEFIGALHAAKKPLVGICWGHQAISKALGGTVEVSQKGYGMGIKTTQVLKRYNWNAQAPESVHLYSMHQCQVTVPPPEGELFLSSGFCQYAGFTVGDHIVTMQQHPDYNINVMLAMIERRADRLSKEDLQIAKDSIYTPHHTELACKWVGDFFASKR